jgi:uncharacterized protein (DUF433 family)
MNSMIGSPHNPSLQTPELPLHLDEQGAIRVGNTRITLDLVIEHYQNGMTPEEMVREYDSLKLADVYGAIAYFLSHTDDVLQYMKKRKEEADALRAKIEAERPRISRDELIARAAAKQTNAQIGQ